MNPPDQRRRWLPRLLLGLALMLGVAVIGVVFAPAGVVANLVPRLAPEVQLLAPAGRVHRGSARLLIEGTSVGRLHWQLQPGQLATGRAAFNVQLRSDSAQLDGEASARLDGYLQVRGVTGAIAEAGLQALLAPYEIVPGGEVRVRDLHLAMHQRSVVEAAGQLDWDGGPVRYRLAGQPWYADLPPLQAQLQTNASGPELALAENDGSALLDARLDAEGWVHLRIRYRLVMLAGFPWPDGPSPDTVVLELSERLLP